MADIEIRLVVKGQGVENIDRASKGMETLADRAKKVGSGLESLGGKISGVGTSITAVALPLAGLATQAVRTSASFEDAFLRIENLVGRSREETEFFRQAVLDLGPEVAIGPNELADALFAVTSAGAGAGEALDENNSALQILESSAKAAALGLGDTRTIALATTAATTAYGTENLSAAQAVETLVQTVKFGNLEASELAGTLGRVIPIAAETGATFQDVGSFIATFTRLGGDAAEATTALRGILGAIVKPGTQAQEAFAAMGTSASELRNIIATEGLDQALLLIAERSRLVGEATLSQAIPNIRALTGVLATAGSQGEAFAEIANAMRQETDALGEGFANLEGTTSFTFGQFAAQAETSAIKFGDALAPALLEVLKSAEPVFDVVIAMADGFAALPQPVQTAAVGFTALVAAMGPFLIITGQAIAGAGRLVQVFATLGPAVLKLPGAFSSAASGATAFAGRLGRLGQAGLVVGTFFAAFTLTKFVLEVTGAQAAIDSFIDSMTGLEAQTRGEVFSPQMITLIETAEQKLSELTGETVVFTRSSDGFREAQEKLNLYNQAQRLAAQEGIPLREAFDQVVAGAKEVTQAGPEAGDALGGEGGFAGGAGAGTDAAKEFQEAVSALVNEISGGRLAGEMEVAIAAIEQLGGVSEITRSGLESLAPIIEELRLNSEELPPPLREVALELSRIALFEGIGDLDFEAPTISAEQWAAAMGEVGDEFEDVAANGIPGVQTGEAVIGGVTAQAFDLDSAMSGVNDLLSEARGLMNLFGVDSDSALGKVIDGATKIFDTFNSVLGIVDKVSGAFGKFGGLFGGGGGGGGGIGGLLGGLFGGGGGGGAATGTAAGAGGGGLAGIFGGLGKAAGAAFTNPFGLAVLGGLGAFFAGKALFGIFGGRDAQTVMEEAGRDLGVSLTEGLAEEIHKSGQNIQLFLPEIFAEGNLGVDRLAEEVGDIFSVLAQGKISEPEAIAALQESTQVLLQNFDQLGATGEAQLERVLRAADATGLQFEASGEAATALAQRLVESAQQGGDAWLNAQNAIGTTGRESLEFLKNEYGAALPESVLAAINSILGLNQAVNETAGGANQIGREFSELPGIAQESVAGIGVAFTEGSTQITEGLQPVSDKIANEIREAGSSTSEAVRSSFGETNAAIEAGLTQVAGTFAGPVTSSAERAAAAANRLAQAAQEAARNASSINFPSGPGGGGEADLSAAGGFRGVLPRDTMIQAHQGEFVSITPRDQTRRMDFVSAQEGLGPSPFQVTTGGNTFMFQIDNAGGGAQDMRQLFQREILPLMLEAVRRDEQELMTEIRNRQEAR